MAYGQNAPSCQLLIMMKALSDSLTFIKSVRMDVCHKLQEMYYFKGLFNIASCIFIRIPTFGIAF